MSSAPPCRTLGEYVRELVARLGAAEPSALVRLRTLVGTRRARITLDDETVVVALGPRGVGVRATRGGGAADGWGRTDRATTLALLDGYLEVTEAVHDGRLQLAGTIDDLARMGQVIELLLDLAARQPTLQELARDYRDDPCRAAPSVRAPASPTRAPLVGPPSTAEQALLTHLDLLPP